MRISAPFANIRIVQSRLLGKHLPDAYVFDPMEILAAERPPKKSLMLVTVGATLPFDRMVSSVATLKINGTIEEDVVIQTGVGGARPSGLETHEVLPFDQMLALLREADIVVCHGGTGSIITALREGCRVVAMPRRFEDGEHYDNHQLEITRALEQRGLIAVAQSTEELAHALSIVRSRPPVTATLRPSELVEFLKSVIDDWRSEADGSSSSKIFGVEMCTLTAGELVDSIVNSPPRDGVRLLATMNVDHVVRLRTDERFRKAYARAWRITADGAPVFAYARTRNIPVPQRLTGSDLTPDLLRRMPFDRCLFFVVSSSETGERLLSSLIDRGFPERQLAYLCPPFGFESDRMMSSKIVEAITAHGTTDLFLGVGAPKSEIWVDEHRDMLGNMYAYCFGAGLDYFAGRSTRAPIAFRNMGMEWFWRLTREPVRLWHRYLIDSWAFFPAVFQDLRGRAPHGKRRIHD
jgi:N-acetylglucosaminyldiphosphoundecaprenol N-acetyl-beta-D-mannosaminyltransferase